MKKTTVRWLSVLASVCLITAIICASFQLVAFSSAFYDYQWEKRDAIKQLGTTPNDLERMKRAILGVLSGRRNDMELQAQIDGVQTDVFTEEETLHMLDVQRLLRFDAVLMYIMLAVFAALAVLIGVKNGREGLKRLAGVYLITLLITAVLLGIIGLIASVNFDSAFTVFHKIVFTNDLWLMPEESVIIRLMPLGFFTDAAYGVIRMLVLLGVLTAGFALSFRMGKTPHPADFQEENIYQG